MRRDRLALARVAEVLASAVRMRGGQLGRYQAGLSSRLELLDAEGLEQQAQQRSIGARRDESVAALHLLMACGMLGQQP